MSDIILSFNIYFVTNKIKTQLIISDQRSNKTICIVASTDHFRSII